MFLHAQVMVAVAVPSPAEVQLVEDAPNLVFAREEQSQCVVFAITGIGYLNLSQQGGEKGSGSSKPVDAKSVVRTVLVCPFAMTDKAWWYCLQIEVAQAVAAYHHGGPLLIEGVYQALQRLGRRIQVVTVQLYGEASAAFVVHGHVPAAANAQVGTLGDEVNKPFVGAGQFLHHAGRAVGRVVVHHHHVEGKCGLLCECRLDGVGNRLFAVEYRDDYRGFKLEVLLFKVG